MTTKHKWVVAATITPGIYVYKCSKCGVVPTTSLFMRRECAGKAS